METNEKMIEASEKGFSLIESFEIVNDIPPAFKKVREDKKQMIEFFNKIPENKVMKIRFPSEQLWNSYFTALKYYASDYPYDMKFSKRKDDAYFIYIKKISRRENE